MGRVLVTFVLLLMIWGVAVSFDNLDHVMALTGATSQMMNGFLFPAFFYLLGYLRVSDRSEGNTGIGLASLGQEHVEDVGAQPPQTQGALRKPAWVMAVAGMVLMPVMIAIELWKMFDRH